MINLDSMIRLSLVLLMGNRYFTLKTFFRMSGGRGQKCRKVEVEINISALWVQLSLRNVVILQ